MTPRMHRRRLLELSAAGVAGIAMTGAIAPGAGASRAQDDELDPDVQAYLEPAEGKHDPPNALSTVAVAFPTVSYDEGDDINNNPWTRAYEQKYGIDVETQWAVPGDQYAQRVNLMLTSGELPDYFAVSDEQFKELADNDALEDLTDVYEASASDRIKEMVTSGGDIPIQSATLDGRLMAIPNVTVAKEGASVLWVRGDWLEALGLPEPTTMETLLQVADGFASQDPNGSGSADTFGISLDKDLNSIEGFLNGHHAYSRIWLDDGSGQLVYSSIQPEMKTALGQLQQMYEAGQIDREFGAKGGTEVWEDLISGRSGLWYGSVYSGVVPIGDAKRTDESSDWIPYQIPSVDEAPATPKVGAGLTNGREQWVVRKGVENVADIFTLIDFWIETFYENTNDPIYRHFVQPTPDRAVWQMNSIQLVKPYKNLEQSNAIVEIIETGSDDTSGLTAEGRDNLALIQSWLDDGNIDGYGWDRCYGPTGAMQRVIRPYVDEDRFIQSQFYGAATPAMVSRQATLEALELETFTKIIQGESIDEFDAFVDTWMSLGGEEITAEVNEWAANR